MFNDVSLKLQTIIVNFAIDKDIKILVVKKALLKCNPNMIFAPFLTTDREWFGFSCIINDKILSNIIYDIKSKKLCLQIQELKKDVNIKYQSFNIAKLIFYDNYLDFIKYPMSDGKIYHDIDMQQITPKYIKKLIDEMC